MTNNTPKVTLQEITEETLGSILKMAVSETQKNFVAPNSVSIAQAHFSKTAWFRAVYADETPVGFVMLHIDETIPEYFVWRFMIDKNHQGKGYGRQAMARIIEHVRTFSNATALYLSYVPEENNPGPFYRKLGFVDTGEIVDEEMVMKLDL